jgi:hypothetical protein
MLVEDNNPERKRQQEILRRDELYQKLAEVAWSRLEQQYQFPERKNNSIISRKGILVSPDQEKGEALFITEESEKLSNDGTLHYLVIRVVVESLAIHSGTVAVTIAFDIDQTGKFKRLNTAISRPQQVFFDIDKLEALLESVSKWPTKSHSS